MGWAENEWLAQCHSASFHALGRTKRHSLLVFSMVLLPISQTGSDVFCSIHDLQNRLIRTYHSFLYTTVNKHFNKILAWSCYWYLYLVCFYFKQCLNLSITFKSLPISDQYFAIMFTLLMKTWYVCSNKGCCNN